MGIHGNSTCSLSLGGKGQCRGTLLGEENKGMRAMFLMMNEARLLVGLQGFGCASASYMNALNYARERVQGKNLLKAMDTDAPSVPIIQHPDIRRQLMTMKAYVEGFRNAHFTALQTAAFLIAKLPGRQNFLYRKVAGLGDDHANGFLIEFSIPFVFAQRTDIKLLM